MPDPTQPPEGEPVIRAIAMPADTNPAGDIFGGWLMSQMDLAGANAAVRRARGRCVTVAVDGMVFHEDAYQLTCASERYNMEITITTPALLFPAISLLMISYTTRFLHLAHLARSLHAINPGAPEPTVLEQIKNIRKRILFIRNMQATGISSLLLCVVCMFLLFGGQAHI